MTLSLTRRGSRPQMMWASVAGSSKRRRARVLASGSRAAGAVGGVAGGRETSTAALGRGWRGADHVTAVGGVSCCESYCEVMP